MLFLVILLKALVFALIAYVAGAALALTTWAIGLLVKLRIWAFVRWGIAGVLVLVYVFAINPDLISEASISDEAWREMAYGTNAICMVLAALALIITGVIISITKGSIRFAVKGAQAAARAANQPTSPPPLPPSGN